MSKQYVNPATESETESHVTPLHIISYSIKFVLCVIGDLFDPSTTSGCGPDFIKKGGVFDIMNEKTIEALAILYDVDVVKCRKS